MKASIVAFLLVSARLLVHTAAAQAVNDTTFHFPIEKPYFTSEAPSVFIDKAHNNSHTRETGCAPLAQVLAQDGFSVYDFEKIFSESSLNKADILVIVNALHDSNVRDWSLPNPSAFTASEVVALNEWVKQGGKLFISADHMPCGGAAQNLMKSFGVEWSNSFDQSRKQKWPPAVFSRETGMLLSSPVTDSSHFAKPIDLVGTFTGSAFRFFEEGTGTPFLVFDDAYQILFPKVAWKFTKKTKGESAKGWFQGATMTYGKGKIVMMGESAMFTAQIRNRTKIGMNSPDAPQNAQLMLNIFRYLAIDE